MIDHDRYDIPKGWKDQRLSCICALFNHSCEGNSYFSDKAEGFGETCYALIARGDIEPGFVSNILLVSQ